MIEIILVLVIVFLVGLLSWKEYLNKEERTKFINALIAKSPQDMAMLDSIQKQPKEPKMKVNDLIPESEMSQEQLEEMIKKGIV